MLFCERLTAFVLFYDPACPSAKCSGWQVRSHIRVLQRAKGYETHQILRQKYVALL